MRRASFSCKNTNFLELRENIIFLIFLFYLLLPIIVIALITGSLLRQGFTKRLSIVVIVFMEIFLDEIRGIESQNNVYFFYKLPLLKYPLRTNVNGYFADLFESPSY